MAVFKPCSVCGVKYLPHSPHDRGCSEHSGRANRSPSTQAQDREYARNRKVVLADDPFCRWCGSPHATTVDHVVAVANGGTNDISNLVACCARCNASKKDNPGWNPPNPNPSRQTGAQSVTDPRTPPLVA